MIALLAALAIAGPHADHVAQFGASDRSALRPQPALLPAVTRGPDRIVYGYEAYWNANLNTVPWDDLSHLAIFSAEVNPNGTLINPSRFDRAADVVAIAQAYGVKVHLCVTNFNSSELISLLSSPTARQTLIDELVGQVRRTGAHGVNIDFEGMPASQRANMVTFVTDLAAEIDEVVLATPAVDWSSAWDYAALSELSWLFIMGYGYHWSGSDFAGPGDPLYGGGVWSRYSLDWTARDYISEGADPAKVIMGLPLYGNKWPVSSTTVPAPTTGRGSAVTFSIAWANALSYGEHSDPGSHSLYYNHGGEQTWYGDTETFRDRVRYTHSAGLGGFGFWALHYTSSDPTFWAMIHDETAMADEPDEPDDPGQPDDPTSSDTLIANAGRPFLAYVGDTVILSAKDSQVPDNPTYRWTQQSGPTANLAHTDAVEVSFVVTDSGVIELSLEVGDGRQWSAPDITQVVVIERDIGKSYRSCGLSGAPLLAGTVFGLIGAVSRRRSRQR